MNEDILKGKWKTLRGEAKIWWGQHESDPLMELDGNKDKIAGWLQEKKGLTKEDAEKDLRILQDVKNSMERQSVKVIEKIKAQFDKFSHQEIMDIDGNVEAWAKKIQEKYNDSQEDANEKIKDFMSQF